MDINEKCIARAEYEMGKEKPRGGLLHRQQIDNPCVGKEVFISTKYPNSAANLFANAISEITSYDFRKEYESVWGLKNKFRMEKIVFNKPATIVFWNKTDKTVVKATENDEYNPEYGFLIAYFEKNSGMTRTQVNKFMVGIRSEYEKQLENKKK